MLNLAADKSFALFRVSPAIDVLMTGSNDVVMNRDLRILIVEPDPERVQGIISALTEAGWTDVKALAQISALDRTVKKFVPDIVLIDLSNPDRDTLEHISFASETSKRAVALFVDQTDDALTQAALNAGVSAYVVDGLKMERIKSVLETAIARFKIMRQMQSELDAAKQALEDRKTIDRAKGILMRQRNISEDDAYTLLRKTAMGQNRKVIDVAHALVTAADLLS
ncbi:putative transcriptional regulatory protein pdtaR [Pseudooctadecabacter jejudonensis]|uniref:Putative transcriptional regulatory protein pdtaR n=2 Tax=Pseudooctadecabacter jejudonensis TaxID=1391910 RepID=A0A1Y5RZ59_9RHOB|nr:putative transcriptional regulatory protein pdtaR [Pseudooctadecabacter jejudonensis]